MPESVKSARRALDVLELLTAREAELTFTEIGTVLDLPRSSLHGLLRTLVEAGWLEYREGSHGYALGIRTLEAGNAYSRSLTLAERAYPVMTGIRDQIGETVQLAVLDGRHNVYIAKVDGFQVLRLASEVGRRLPAHATGLGKVLLAGLTQAEFDRVLGAAELERYTERTVTDRQQLTRDLAVIRKRGFAEDREEYSLGVRCVAVPVRNQRAVTVAAMSVSVPTVRFHRDTAERALELLVAGASQVSAALGFNRPGHGPGRNGDGGGP